VALLGSNGAGKSITLRAISGLVPLATGQIHWSGRMLKALAAHRIVQMGVGHCLEGTGCCPACLWPKTCNLVPIAAAIGPV
jgi:branched-chain amino acid transport system ATP-binding protein